MASKRLQFSKVTQLKLGNKILEDYERENWNPEMKEIHSMLKQSDFKVLDVEKINNPYLYGMYLLHKEEMIKNSKIVIEDLLYHCTSPSNGLKIASKNIDWRLTCRTRFGQGACFSKSPRYAHTHAGSDGVFVVCKVLMSVIQNLYLANYNLKIPSDGYDTTLGNNGQVYVKYDDFTFYPKYIIYYK
ncbi:Poly(ADP-ribose) polymerase, catalytic domain [Cinara cedri]|uniref:Poly [ADP-ribose] polymerase n=1 Tax=Cinara cedri TaxID=506608 RepID=A0A5E4MRI7_9HEMI|nr:Poly(ADP-ribose) polymerase, catalytic domain [Cinara cedri]